MDMEKVIKGLEEITDYFFDIYRNDTDSYKCAKAQGYSDCAIDAIALLKEQQKRIETLESLRRIEQEGGDVMQSAIDAFNKANSVPQICFPGNGELT